LPEKTPQNQPRDGRGGTGAEGCGIGAGLGPRPIDLVIDGKHWHGRPPPVHRGPDDFIGVKKGRFNSRALGAGMLPGKTHGSIGILLWAGKRLISLGKRVPRVEGGDRQLGD